MSECSGTAGLGRLPAVACLRAGLRQRQGSRSSICHVELHDSQSLPVCNFKWPVPVNHGSDVLDSPPALALPAACTVRAGWLLAGRCLPCRSSPSPPRPQGLVALGCRLENSPHHDASHPRDRHHVADGGREAAEVAGVTSLSTMTTWGHVHDVEAFGGLLGVRRCSQVVRGCPTVELLFL
jgi:hypothetical protein